MPSMRLTGDEIAEIIASAQALTDMPAEERRAAELLKELLGGEYKPRDTAGAQGMHDFDLRLDDGKTFAVEVTTDTSRVHRAFQDQVNRISPLEVPGTDTGLACVPCDPWQWSPRPASQPQAHKGAPRRNCPDILRQIERAGLTELSVPPSPHRDNHAAHSKLRGLGVQLCYSFDASPDQNPRVEFGWASVSGATGPSMIVEAVNENLPNKVKKLLDAKTAGAAEAHLFLWLNFEDQHKWRRAAAMSFRRHAGIDGLVPINLHDIDAVWVAVDAALGDDPYCRHTWPILCFGADGWHDWRLRRSR